MRLNEFLASREKIVLGYLGGSITEGAGASCDAANYASLVTEWFAKEYPAKQFTMVNAGVGGTDSTLGAFRVERDLLSKAPDLVFIEFAVNDTNVERESCINAMEGIVRKILQYNPSTPLVFLYTLSNTLIERYYAKGELPVSVMAHDQVAKHYKIPALNIGKQLYERMLEEGAQVTDYLPDTTHPNDKGYAFYAENIENFLSQADWQAGLPQPLSVKNYENAQLLLAGRYADSVWKLSQNDMHGRLPQYIYSDQVGATLEFHFTGPAVGLYFSMDSDSGNVYYSIDEKQEGYFAGWDSYSLRFDRANARMLARDLSPGSHTLTLRILPEKEPLSKGHFCRIGAFLVLS